jgi:ribosomal protein L11 methyltransferase
MLGSVDKKLFCWFHTEDVPVIEEVCNKKRKFENRLVQDNWTAASFIKNNYRNLYLCN